MALTASASELVFCTTQGGLARHVDRIGPPRPKGVTPAAIDAT
jgi:hypothetical protein